MSVTTPPAPPDLTPLDRVQLVGSGAARELTGSTPARLRLLSLLTLAMLALTALLGFVAATALTTNTDRAVDNTGPVLVATQDAFASIAEADAASAAVFLAGTQEDREQRRLYELALVRATAQLEEVSRLVGDNDADHDSLKAIAADLTTYAGIVEAARVANVGRLPGAAERLESAIDIVRLRIVPEIEAITERTQRQLDDDVSGGRATVIIAFFVGLAALAAMTASQVFISRRSRRLLNLPLLLASAIVVAGLIWLLTAWVGQQDDLDVARERGYDSIALTAQVQSTAFRYKTLESLTLIADSDAAELDTLADRLATVDVGSPTLIDDARQGRAAGSGLLLETNREADSTREQAATAEMLIRWDRYRDTSRAIQVAIAADETDAAIELAIGPGNTDFNGFNTSVESVLSDNRAQFTSGLADARNRLSWLQAAMVALPVAAALLTLWGFQLRIREYRR